MDDDELPLDSTDLSARITRIERRLTRMSRYDLDVAMALREMSEILDWMRAGLESLGVDLVIPATDERPKPSRHHLN